MTDWNQVAFVFPGQASQAVGMGKEIAEAYPAARDAFQQADDVLGFKLSELCFEGPEDQLNETINTQPAVYVCSVAILRALQAELPDVQPAFVAGHSLGELTALTAAGSLTFRDGVHVVRERGRLMKEAGEVNPGAMAALLGLDMDDAREVCQQAFEQVGKPVIAANDNSPGQVVISGDEEALEAAMDLANDAGARRVIRLAVSIAAHSPLMEEAAKEFRWVLEDTHFDPPQIPVYTNRSAAPLDGADSIPEVLAGQLTNPVRWTETIRNMIAAGAEQFAEVGPGDVLTGLLRRIDRSKTGVALNNLDALRAYAQSARA